VRLSGSLPPVEHCFAVSEWEERTADDRLGFVDMTIRTDISSTAEKSEPGGDRRIDRHPVAVLWNRGQ
jgi:hypothetical protein